MYFLQGVTALNNINHLSARDKLEQEYFKLLEEKHYSKITVAELIENAGVSRMTFYRNYEDIFDMHQKVCKHIINSLVEQLAEIFDKKEDELTPCFEKFCIKLNSQRKYLALLSGDNADRYLYEICLPIIMEYGDKLANGLDENRSFALRFVALSGIATYFYTLVTDKEYPPEYIKIYKSIYDLAEKAEDIKQCTNQLTEN